MARITFADDQAGTQNPYELPINPYDVQPMDDADLVQTTEVIDGIPVIFEKNDNRIHTLVWQNIPRTEPYITMIDTLTSYRRQEKYMSFQDISSLLNKSGAYLKVFIVDLDIRARAGHSGMYNSIVLKYLKL
jgi:hypothetical protein